MNYIIIGTAGHIDHGKTTLIEAMSGYNGDELEIEKERGITIDLSFSNMNNGETNIAFIDVPGHEKLIKNMISGAFGFDATLFVIDVNEGIMPQTIEHLEVLNFLNIQNIVIALSKCDLSNKKTIQKREKEVQDFINSYENLKLLKIFKTSTKDKSSINSLKKYLFTLKAKEDSKDERFFRYYIDRAFSIKGFGEVATGTVLNGKIQKGKKVYSCELNKEILVKNIQIHSKESDIALKHQRAALNLNIPHGELKKGYLLTNKGYFRGFNSIDVFVKNSENNTIKHDSSILFLYGAKSIDAKIYLYSQEKIDGGYLAKITFKEKVYLMHNDRFVLLANNHIVGGGIVLDPTNDPIKKNKKIPLLKAILCQNYTKAFSLLVNNHKKGFGLISSIQRFALSHDEAIKIANKMDGVFIDKKALVVYPQSSTTYIKNIILNIYEKNPYAFLSPNSLMLRIKWASESLIKMVLDAFVETNFLEIKKNIYKRVDIGDVNIEKELENKIKNILENSNFTPPAPYNMYDDLDIDRKIGDKILKKLTSSKKVIRIAHNLFISSKNLSSIISIQKEIIKKEGYIDIALLKNKLSLSRKYAIGYLEYLDKLHEIKKDGNKRYLV